MLVALSGQDSWNNHTPLRPGTLRWWKTTKTLTRASPIKQTGTQTRFWTATQSDPVFLSSVQGPCWKPSHHFQNQCKVIEHLKPTVKPQPNTKNTKPFAQTICPNPNLTNRNQTKHSNPPTPSLCAPLLRGRAAAVLGTLHGLRHGGVLPWQWETCGRGRPRWGFCPFFFLRALEKFFFC